MQAGKTSTKLSLLENSERHFSTIIIVQFRLEESCVIEKALLICPVAV